MAKPRESVASSALDELLTNQAVVMAEVQPSATNPPSPTPSKPKRLTSPRPSTRPQQTHSGSSKSGGEDGKKTTVETTGSKPEKAPVETLYAKIPEELMKAMKLHLMFSESNGTTMAELVTRTLYPCFERELSEVRERNARLRLS